ncbi:MAG: hypothetical protein ACOC46_04490 [Pirellulales bacterium]
MCVDADRRREFEKLGHRVALETEEALERAAVVIDCTPAGNEHKEQWYRRLSGPRGFIAQGSEFGFGKPYARGVNDAALVPGEDRFVQVVSCNTHNLSVLIQSLAGEPRDTVRLREGRFVCIRRANDISQEGDFCPSPRVGRHDDPRFGTHHARDAWHVFHTLGHDLQLFSSALKVNTQYMHALWFDLVLDRRTTHAEVVARLTDNPRVALTEKTDSGLVFSFGRDHGFFGRILSQTVVSVPTITVRGGREVVGFCFTPQDGNALLSSVTATLWFLYPEGYERRLDAIRPYFFSEV